MMTEETKVPVEQLGGPVVSVDSPLPEGKEKKDGGEVSDLPPAYFDLFGKVRKANTESEGNVEYVKKVSCIFKKKKQGPKCSLCGLIFSLAFPIASIVIGSLNLNNCSVERYIPIYLIVGGAFGVFKALLQTIDFCVYKAKTKCGNCKCKRATQPSTDCEQNQPSEQESEQESPEYKKNPLICLIDLFLFSWLIAGSVWVYRLYGSVDYDNVSSSMYCDKTTYLFTFWSITVCYMMMALGLVFCCCMGVVMCGVAASGKWECK